MENKFYSDSKLTHTTLTKTNCILDCNDNLVDNFEIVPDHFYCFAGAVGTTLPGVYHDLTFFTLIKKVMFWFVHL